MAIYYNKKYHLYFQKMKNSTLSQLVINYVLPSIKMTYDLLLLQKNSLNYFLATDTT